MKNKVGIWLVVIFIIAAVGMFIWNYYDYNQEDFLLALEAGEDVRGKSVYLEVESVDENVMTGWTMTSTNGILFINGAAQDVTPGDMVLVEVDSFGSAFGTWIITYYND